MEGQQAPCLLCSPSPTGTVPRQQAGTQGILKEFLRAQVEDASLHRRPFPYNSTGLPGLL